MIGFSGIARLATQLFARLEAHHWVAVGASVVLHLAVILGWPSEPPAEPQAINFEIAFEPPAAEPLPASREKTKPVAKQIRAKKLAAKKKPRPNTAQREPHLLDANWRAESMANKDVPALALPEANALGLHPGVAGDSQSKTRASQLEQTPPGTHANTHASGPINAKQPPRHSTNPTDGTASDGGPGLSEPEVASMGGAASHPGESGVTLANSPTQAARQALNLDNGGSGARENTEIAPLAAMPAASGSGASQGGLQTAQTSQTALSATSGAPAAAISAMTAASTTASVASTVGGDEPRGARLTASGVAASVPALPAGAGSLAAGPHTAALTRASDQSARATPSAFGPAGGGTLTGRAGTPASGAISTSARSGSSQASPGATSAGRGGPARESAGRLGVASAVPTAMPGGASTASVPSRSGHVGASAALAPGEPGGSPRFAVTLQPIVASLANPYLPARSGRSGAGVSGEAAPAASRADAGGTRGASNASGGMSSMPFVGSAVTAATVPGRATGSPGGVGGPSTQPGRAAAAAVLEAARDTGHAPVVLRAAQVVPVQVVRPDTEIQRLDVLAPSNYCPLPLPGHNQPENRAPLPDPEVTEQPAYALDNPVITYPVLANIRGIEGRVTVRVEVLATGRPGKMWLKQSSGSGILDQDAQAQLKQWRFVPARKNGRTVTAWIDVPVLYRLSEAR